MRADISTEFGDTQNDCVLATIHYFCDIIARFMDFSCPILYRVEIQAALDDCKAQLRQGAAASAQLSMSELFYGEEIQLADSKHVPNTVGIVLWIGLSRRFGIQTLIDPGTRDREGQKVSASCEVRVLEEE